MGLKLPIDHNKITDSPLNTENKNLFEFVSSDTQDFVQDIVNGHPTCYLISGYRGAGKSSWVRKLANDAASKNPKVIFVYMNFVKYEQRPILLRKVIRNLYLQLSNNSVFEHLEQKEELRETLADFFELYERTFFEVSKNTNEKRINTTVKSVQYEKTIKELGEPIVSLIVFVTALAKLDWSEWQHYILAALSFLWFIFQPLKYLQKKQEEKSSLEEKSKNSFYDDEIAEYYLTEILKSLQKHIKLVFVFDELDKIEDHKLLSNLISELKPLMLSGLASFIVVAGQNLSYEYHNSKNEDDGILSSLFSRVHHVSLLSTSELRTLLFRFIAQESVLSDSEKQIWEAYCDYLIFQSKLIPRRLIIQVRQSLIWENGAAYLEIDKSLTELNIYSKIIKRIDKINDEEIATMSYPDVIRDFYIMQLFIASDCILKTQSSFSANDIIKKEQ